MESNPLNRPLNLKDVQDGWSSENERTHTPDLRTSSWQIPPLQTNSKSVLTVDDLSFHPTNFAQTRRNSVRLGCDKAFGYQNLAQNKCLALSLELLFFSLIAGTHLAATLPKFDGGKRDWKRKDSVEPSFIDNPSLLMFVIIEYVVMARYFSFSLLSTEEWLECPHKVIQT